MDARNLLLCYFRKPARRERLLWLALLAAGVGIFGFLFHVGTSLPDFREFQAGPERKAAFFAFVQPLIEDENAAVLKVRRQLLAIADQEKPGWLERRWLARLAAEYGLEDAEHSDSSLNDRQLIAALLRRVDTVPLSLALAQSAKESGWGTSRFARKGNNLFGEWCFDQGCGHVPRARADDATHEVQAFLTPRRSVRSYVRNLNTHPEYAEFRRERAQLRNKNRPLSGILLAGTMSQYSERRDAYVEELKQLILSNKLENRQSEASKE
ncbi:MAG TPA: glucosaminidase domain-containing protein [Woeseiaceae bacterium]|nr:glucosaminidase domain-containing protein [Woeseiaceae bacterium]